MFVISGLDEASQKNVHLLSLHSVYWSEVVYMKITDFRSVVNHGENHNEEKIAENLEHVPCYGKVVSSQCFEIGGGGDLGATPLVYKHA